MGNDAPAWSPDGKLIAFTGFHGGHVGDIFVMRPDGSGLRNLTRNPAHDDLAAWSPDGTRIAFTSHRDGNPEIYVMNSDGSDQTRLTHDPEADLSPTWSPDGRRIAFRSGRDGNGEIYSMNADGSDLVRLTHDPASDHSPSWGPDGRIAFVSNRFARRTAIYVMNADGSGLERLTPPLVFWNEEHPVWSPDGTRIAYQSDRAGLFGTILFGNTEIFVRNVDGSADRQVTFDVQREDWPTWSPDATRLAFARGSFFSPEIYVANTDGSGLRRLTRSLVVLREVGVTASAAVAGGRFEATLLVSTPARAPVAAARVSCAARIGQRTLPALTHRFVASSARCVWRIPADARGKRLEATIIARAGASEISKKLVRRVR